MDTAEELIQQHGFHGFSFQDIAERIGIKKASIYYHFPAKAELGRAVIDRYRLRMREVRDAVDQADGIDHWQALALYLEPIVALGHNPEKACLCGVLGGEYVGLPEEMQREITSFFAEHQTWLAHLLISGRKAGEFVFEGDPATLAKFLFSALEGGLLIKRTTGDTGYVDELVETAAIILGQRSPI
ncbi:MAG: TetR/AcrR family transcriptional regulator [Geminicoccaceae bacterium]